MAWVSPQLSRLSLTFAARSDLASYTIWKHTNLRYVAMAINQNIKFN